MYHKTSAQNENRCDVCETTIVHSYCDFCHVNLCKLCIGEHISDGYQRHAIVPFQERKSTLIFPKCATHQHKTCDFKCKDCNVFACSSCVGSKQHKEHDILELVEVFKKQKINIDKDMEEYKNILSPTYEEIVLDLENQIDNFDGGYEKLITDMSTQGKEWHKTIDMVNYNH